MKKYRPLIGVILMTAGLLISIVTLVWSIVSRVQNPDMTDMRWVITHIKDVAISLAVSAALYYLGRYMGSKS